MDTRSIQEQAVSLANRSYWDTFGAESESLTLKQKLVNLGTFVHRGGNIADVVNLYVELTDDESRLDAVQWMVFSYLDRWRRWDRLLPGLWRKDVKNR